MRFLYLILAHRDLDQLRALVARLLRDDPGDAVILHFDARSEVTDDELANLADAFNGRVILVRRVPIWWGHASICEAELALLEAASIRTFDQAHLLSGQDWPIRTRDEIAAAITPGVSYVSFEPDMSHRMNDHHFDTRWSAPMLPETALRYYRKRALREAARLYDGLLARLGRARTCPVGPEWKKGSQWWSLAPDAVAYLVPRLRAMLRSGRLRWTVCSDEHAIQTLLFYAPFAASLQSHRRLILWDGGSSPRTMERTDLPAIRSSDAWFARKFDRRRDPFFLDL